MVISRSDIGNEWSEHIKWRAATDALLDLHVCFDFVHGHMTGALDHDLHIFCPRAACQFAESYEFFDLADIGRISKTSRTAGVAKRDRDIVFTADIEDLVVMLIERIFFAGHAHPRKYQRSSAGNDIHLSSHFLDLLDRLSRDTAVESYKVHTVFGMKSYHIDKILRRQCRKVSLIMNDRVIDRNRTDHGRTLAGKFSSKRLCISVRGKVHDRLGAHIDRRHDLLHLDVIVLAILGYTEIDVDLGSEHRADTVWIDTGVKLIGADRDLTVCDPLTDLLFCPVFFLCDRLHLRGNDPLSSRIHLCRVLSHYFFLISMIFCFSLCFSFPKALMPFHTVRSYASAVRFRARDQVLPEVLRKYMSLQTKRCQIRSFLVQGKMRLQTTACIPFRAYSDC